MKFLSVLIIGVTVCAFCSSCDEPVAETTGLVTDVDWWHWGRGYFKQEVTYEYYVDSVKYVGYYKTKNSGSPNFQVHDRVKIEYSLDDYSESKILSRIVENSDTDHEKRSIRVSSDSAYLAE